MSELITLKNNFARILSLFAFFLIISLSAFSPLPYKPNVFIVFLILLVFVAEDFSVFLFFLSLEALWLKYVSYPSAEVVFMVVAGLVLYLLSHWIVLSRKVGVFILLMLITQAAFWAIFYRGLPFFTPVFLMEFLYNCVVALILYSTSIWLAKKFISKTRY